MLNPYAPVFPAFVPFQHPPLCAGCLGDLGLVSTGDVACLSCGVVVFEKAVLEKVAAQ